MNDVPIVIGSATLLLAAGMWLMLPRGAAAGRSFGTLLVAISLGLFASQVPRLGNWVNDSVFLILAAVAVLSAVATVTFRNPVYSAIWFGLSLLGTAGLFLFQGAQFLGVATIVVYAGAILVTFLFVLMLAQPEGQAFYDRLSWGARLSALTGALVVGVLTLTVVSVFQGPAVEDRPQSPFSKVALDDGILADQHMANLGAQLFSKNLVAVEVAGTLLLVALVGTVAIVAQIHKPAGGRERSHG
ncbi:MAG: NADH-quinone oxidoreductase subunit J [Planctomycetia bacterium]|nr:NADH-quinone oxidoreductase subunit J [Planctomycetia bacterium]